MRLLKQKSREYEGKHYYKHWIVLPNKVIQKLEWKEGQELEAKIKGHKLIIEID